MDATPQIEIQRLHKTLAAGLTLEIEQLCVAAGEIIAIVGPVGSGKSALLHLLTGQSRPTSGTVRVCGLDPLRVHRQISQRIGVVFAENNFYERNSVADNLRFHCRMRALPPARVDEMLNQIGLADQANTLAGKLSPSQGRRLALGRASLHQPSVYLLMEPFAGCDRVSYNLLAQTLRQFTAQGAAAVILAREGIGLANLAGRVYTLEGGRLTRVDTTPDSPEAKAGNDPISGTPFKIPARQEGRVVLINPTDLLYACAEEDQTRLFTIQGEIPSHLSMGELEQRLARNGFFRAHRGYLVNLQRTKAIIPYTRDSYTLILDDPASTEIPLSKSAAKELREMLGY